MNYYETLGVRPDATAGDIKQAYRKLAKENHPDKTMHSGDDTTAQFQAIQKSYSVLSNPEKRAAYDRGEDADAYTNEADRIENTARTEVLKLFDTIIEKNDEMMVDQMNLRDDMLTSIESASTQIRKQKTSIRAQLNKLRKIKRRLRAGDEIFAGLVHQKRQAAVNAIQQNRFGKKVLDRMREIVGDIEYEFDPKITVYGSGSGGFTIRSFEV